MTGSSFGKVFRLTTFGESHGPAVGGVLDGVPAGLPLIDEDVQRELDRRKPGQSDVTTPRQEEDRVNLLSGVFEGATTGTPIGFVVENRDTDPSEYEPFRKLPRPGHADFTYREKYGRRDWRGGGRSSGRETVSRVVGGAVAGKLLKRIEMEVRGHVSKVGEVESREVDFEELPTAEENPVRCADQEAAEEMRSLVQQVRGEGDSVGGVVEVMAQEMPVGLGEPVFDKLEADLAKGLLSIGSVKGFEIGAGFDVAEMRGRESNDPFTVRNGEVVPEKNDMGGTLGGISSGAPLRVRIAVKPTPSISREQRSVDLETMEEEKIRIGGRHDPSIPPRVVPVAEAMVALVLADHALRAGLLNPDRLE
ncbi:MAG: Chorismate synthase [Methanonatronarchaeales archaeon]|nr:Chorismate synthase [Methanonatronarchaeales archaeon]